MTLLKSVSRHSFDKTDLSLDILHLLPLDFFSEQTNSSAKFILLIILKMFFNVFIANRFKYSVGSKTFK